jgi:DNA-binding beta-propeller fold protein YncE
MKRTHIVFSGAICVLAAAAATGLVERGVAAQTRGGVRAPTFQVDPFWPKPLPNHWILGSVTGVALDAREHVWIVHRGLDSLTVRTEAGLALTPPGSEVCCAPAPQVLHFDPAGNLVGHWGGPGQGFDWPVSPGGIVVDGKGNVWIAAAGVDPPTPGRGRGAPAEEGAETGRGGQAGAGRAAGGAAGGGGGGGGAAGGAAVAAGGGQAAGGAAQGGGRGGGGRGGGQAAPPRPTDAQVLKFSSDGKFLLQIGQAGKPGDSASTTGLNRPASVEVDPAANELYVADGAANRRIVVFDANTGAYKRHWGAYGAKPDDSAMGPYDPNAAPAKQFRSPSCVRLAKDGSVYVCDRQNDRIQVFKKDGTFIKEGFVSKTTMGNGSVWDIAFSNDPQQQFLYVADGQDQKVFILRRDTLETVGSIGDGGRWPGYFYGVGSVAVDSKGNVFTGETFEGKRVQKFVRK